MPDKLLTGPERRIIAVSIAAVAVIAGAGALSTWRYQAALAQASKALDERTDASTAAELATTFAEQRNNLNAYYFAPSAAALARVTASQQRFRGIIGQLSEDASANTQENALLAKATAAYARYYSMFTGSRGAAGTGVPRELAAAGSRVARPAARQSVLAIGAHPDDVEIGAAGALAVHRGLGHEISILTLSRGARSGAEDTRAGESELAALALGATLYLEDLQDTRISEGDPTRLLAIQAFGSQVEVRRYLEQDLITSNARYWSRYASGRYAEPFEVVRDSPTIQAGGASGVHGQVREGAA
jgi:GlcNAc-PI de-N-acetylase